MRFSAAIVTALCLTGFAAATQPMLPRCTAALDGQVSQGGCSCGYDRGGQLTARPAGWRWQCDLLRGPGETAAAAPAGSPSEELPQGFTYAPQGTSGGSTSSAMTGGGRSMHY